MFNVHFAILFAITVICNANTITPKWSPPPPKPQPPLNQLASVLKGFKTAEVCKYICTPKSWFGNNGALYVSFKTNRDAKRSAGKILCFSTKMKTNELNLYLRAAVRLHERLYKSKQLARQSTLHMFVQ